MGRKGWLSMTRDGGGCGHLQSSTLVIAPNKKCRMNHLVAMRE